MTRYYDIESTNLIHEVASNGQIEINFKHNTLTRSADNSAAGNNNNNIFYDENDDYAEISQIARYFFDGILDHASSLAAFVTPIVNSYYRLIPGSEAPIYVAWARGNRSTVIRVPVDEKNNYKTKRIEFRAPDPSANPYLAFSALVAAGLDGITNKIEPGNPIDKNVYKMSDFERSNF